MKTISKILSVVLCLTMVIGLFTVGVSAADSFVKVTDGTLTSGQYVLVAGNGYAPGVLDGTWLTAVQPTVSGDSVTDAKGAVWTLTVDGTTVKLTDANGKTVGPKGGNNNGIKESDYSWTWAFENGEFIFSGNGSDTVELASNHGSDFKFRGYKTSTLTGSYAADYSGTFTLYKKSGSGSVTPPPATEATEATEATTPETPSAKLPPITAPVPGTTYKFGMEQVTNGHTVYIAGGIDQDRFLITTTDKNAALDVTVEASGNGYKFAVTIGGTKQYITMSMNSANKATLSYTAEGTVFAFDATISAWCADLNGTMYYIGSYNNFDTLSASKTSYISAANKGVTQFPAGFYPVDGSSVTPPPVTEGTEATTPATQPSTTLAPVAKPVVGTAYKFALVQASLGKTLYFNGKMDGKFFATSENVADAVDVYLEAAQGGYYFYFMDGTTKTYLSLEGYMDNNNRQKASVKLTTEATTVFTHSEEAKTFIHTIGDTSFYLGTYGTYNTMSASSTYYITGDKAADAGVTQFISTFYAPASGSSNTGDASFVSVAAAVLVLSAIGGTALIIKKKEN